MTEISFAGSRSRRARCARRRTRQPVRRVAWQNFADEVASLGRSRRSKMRRRVRNVLEKLITFERSPVAEPGASWADAIRRERADLDLLRRYRPSLRRQAAAEAIAARDPPCDQQLQHARPGERGPGRARQAISVRRGRGAWRSVARKGRLTAGVRSAFPALDFKTGFDAQRFGRVRAPMRHHERV